MLPILLFWVLFVTGYSLRRHLPRTRVISSFRRVVSSDLENDYESSSSSSGISVHNKLEQLKAEKNGLRQQLLAVEIAVKQLEAVVLKTDNETGIFRGSYDYGFSSQSNGCDDINSRNSQGGAVPASAFVLALSNFNRELKNLLNDLTIPANDRTRTKVSPQDEAVKKLSQLQLSNAAIWEREESRPPVKAPWIIKAPYLFLCVLLDTLFDGAPIERFYFLETVARMPYFSYITMLHAYETLGWWRRSTAAKRVHFAEEYNEFNHLLIMESLGGDQKWRVRFLAQHAAIVYFFVLIGLWITSPSLAYNFSQLIEAHAVDTYAEFAESNRDLLQSLAAPPCAKDYYENPDLYIFDEFQTGLAKGTRRPTVNNLYDVFCCIAEDEGQHVATMEACQDPEVIIRSPNTEAAVLATTAAAGLALTYLSEVEGITLDSLSFNPFGAAFESTGSFDFYDVFGKLTDGGETAAVLGFKSQFAQLYESISEILASLLNSGAATVTTIGAEVGSSIGEVAEIGGPAAMETIEAASSEIAQEAALNGFQDAIDISIFLNVIKGLLPFVL